MADGGFLVKFDNKKPLRCYSIAIDYDLWEYRANGAKAKKLSPKLKSIAIKVEDEPRK